MQECFRCRNDFPNILYQFFLVDCRVVAAVSAIRIGCIVSQSLAEGFHNTYIVNHKTVRLTFCHTVCTGNGLHQGMRLHGFINIKA